MLTDLLTAPWFLATWVVLAIASLAVLVHDLRGSNREQPSLMKWVWGLTVAYSGVLGLAGYYWAGRKQIPSDTLARRGFRSVAHCYSGCGAGEITGVVIAAGLLSLGNIGVSVITFVLAYVFGYALTVGPLVQGGESLGVALKDAVYSETASIAVMEIVAIGVDLAVAGSATIGQPLFWSSLVFSLSAGLVAAYPVNVALVHFGVKEGMHNPQHAGMSM